MARLSLTLLGPVRITLDGQPVSGFVYNKGRALLIYLAVEADRSHQRDALVGLLWPELPDAVARTNLRQVLTNLREVIGDASSTPPFLLITRDTIQFNPSSDYDLDTAGFAELLDACATHDHRHLARCRSCAARMQQAITRYHGDFLAEFALGDSAPFDEWALWHREQLHQRALNTLAHLADYHERHGDDAPARRYAQRQIVLEPWREEAHRQLMRLLARGGQRSTALAQYETCRRILARDLSVEPEAVTTALYEQIRDSELEIENEQLKNTDTERFSIFNAQFSISKHNFPAQTTPLVGRETDLAELGALLENPDHRLITIIGPGGIGKTRLALAAATEQAQAFANGATFVPLAAISAVEFVAPAIMAVLDRTFQSQRDPRDQLLEYLRAKELLLVLDNLEQLLGTGESQTSSATDLLADMLQHAPGITLVITSRERLALPGEWLFDLPGLSYPAGDQVDGVEIYGAIQLFMQRAGQVRRQFALADSEARAVARICRLVEGLPLAIELAAAALRTRSCASIADALETSLSALATVLRSIPERHRSIWATFEYSWRLLSDEERQVFRRLSVFRGGCMLAAADAVCAQGKRQTGEGNKDDNAAPIWPSTFSLLPVLAALLDKSLLRWDGVARYDMHELVRQYASEKLEQAGETEQARDTHLAHYLALAEAAEPRLVGTEQLVWMNRLETELGNLRAALRWALERGDRAFALRLSGNMGKFWEVRGYWSEGRQWLDQALALRRDVHTGSNAASSVQSWSAQAFWQAGTLAWRQCDFARAREMLEQSLALYREVDNRDALTYVLGVLGGIAFEQGEYATARAHYEESLAVRSALGKPLWIGDGLFCVGLVAYHEGDYAAAQMLLAESLKLLRETGHTLGITYPLNALGNLANLQGDYTVALTFYEECLALRRALGYKRGVAATLADIANVRAKQGEYAAARAHYEESLTLYRELGNQRGIACVLSGLACLTHAQGRLLTATLLLSAVETLLVQLSVRLDEPQHSDMVRFVAASRAQFDEATFAAAWAAGGALTLEQAVAEALGNAASA